MKAVVMCGGEGRRLRPLTEARPKPLCRILNVPVLETILRRLSGQGVRDIYLSLGFKAQDIVDFCERLHLDATLHYCAEQKPLGTAGGVKNCLSKSDETVLVISGDNLTDLDFSKVLAFHKACGAEFTVVGKDVEDPREYGVILKDEQENILAFSEKPTWEQAQSLTVNTGMYLMEPSILDRIPLNMPFDFSEDLFPALLAEKVKFVCYKTDGYWGDMGEFPAFHEMSRTFLGSGAGDVPMQGALLTEDYTDENGNTFFAPCLIGADAEFGKNNRIGPFCVFGTRLSVGSGCTIRNTIAGDDLTVEDGSDLLGVLIDDNVSVGANCVLEKDAVVGFGCRIGNFTRVFPDIKLWPGIRIAPESVVSRDLLFETPGRIEIDSFGLSGKIYSQISVSDAVRLGQALASVKGTQRIGVGSDQHGCSEIYKNLCCSGIRSCGVICYDFEEMYRAQAFFYSVYCSLDAFIYISSVGDTVHFSFFGRNGLPVSAKTAKKINNNFRFSAFCFADENSVKETFRMNLLSTAYSASLQRLLSFGLGDRKITVECENPCLKYSFSDFLHKAGAADEPGGLQFLINDSGTEMYCVEKDKFYSSDRIKTLLCELEFAQGRDVIVGEDVSEKVKMAAERYGKKTITVYECADEYHFDPLRFMDDLWNFDAVFLCVKLLNVLCSADLTMEELFHERDDFAIRKKVVELDIPASELRERILAAGAKKENAGDVYFLYSTKLGTAKVRQMGNSNRMRILCESKDMETAAELSADVCAKIAGQRIDKKRKK